MLSRSDSLSHRIIAARSFVLRGSRACKPEQVESSRKASVASQRELAHHAQPARLPPPVPFVPLDVLDLLAKDHVQAEHRVVHLVAVDFPDHADAAAVCAAAYRDAVADSEGVDYLLAGVPLLPLLDQK